MRFSSLFAKDFELLKPSAGFKAAIQLGGKVRKYKFYDIRLHGGEIKKCYGK